MAGKRNPYKRADRFTKAAKDQGFKARSVFKLTEAQRRFRVFKQGQRVVDLGCFPGSWTQYVLQQVGRRGAVVGVDLNEPEMAGATFIARSVYEVTSEELLEALGGKAHVVLSDMAPATTGIHLTDHVRQMDLVRCAFGIATQILEPGGTFYVKIFDGEEVPEFQKEVRGSFAKIRRLRPEAVRQNSREFFMLATGFRG